MGVRNPPARSIRVKLVWKSTRLGSGRSDFETPYPDQYAGVAQLAVHSALNREAVGSSPNLPCQFHAVPEWPRYGLQNLTREFDSPPRVQYVPQARMAAAF